MIGGIRNNQRKYTSAHRIMFCHKVCCWFMSQQNY